MTPYRTQAAKKNLQAGVKKMEQIMSPAARVRRDFRLGRPPKPIGENEQPEPLHPVVVWRRANEAVSSFRSRMTAAELKPRHVAAAIVYVERAAPDQPRLLALEEKGKSPEEMQSAAFEVLGRPDVIALGLIFGQIDERTKQKAIFPYLFFGLNQRGMAVLKKAAAKELAAGELLKNVN
jgi:hypothetical protein